MLRSAYNDGWRTALTRYKVASPVAPIPAPLNPQTSAVTMQSTVDKQDVPPGAPHAAAAQKSKVLG